MLQLTGALLDLACVWKGTKKEEAVRQGRVSHWLGEGVVTKTEEESIKRKIKDGRFSFLETHY